MRPIDLIVLHCSATREGQHVDIATLDKWHRERGFKKIGYHYVIYTDGRIVAGRKEEEIGAHAAGFNSRSIGVCYVGGLNSKGKATDTRTHQQLISMRELVMRLMAKYPGAKVVGHRDLSPDRNGDGVITSNEWMKECPSFDVASWVENHCR